MSTEAASALPAAIESRRADIARICSRLGVRRLDLFGSGTRNASPRDLDFLADLGERPPAEYAAAYFALREELEKLFAKPVDIVTPPGLGNPHFRQRVEQEKILLYAA
jgi:predicted nucleotidyltransferase